MPLERIVKKAATGDALGEDIYDVELFKKGWITWWLEAVFTVLTPALPKNLSNKVRVVNSIYSDIMGGSARRSQLGDASLAAENTSRSGNT
jgi:hypothetical protein